MKYILTILLIFLWSYQFTEARRNDKTSQIIEIIDKNVENIRVYYENINNKSRKKVRKYECPECPRFGTINGLYRGSSLVFLKVEESDERHCDFAEQYFFHRRKLIFAIIESSCSLFDSENSINSEENSKTGYYLNRRRVIYIKNLLTFKAEPWGHKFNELKRAAYAASRFLSTKSARKVFLNRW